MSSIEKLLVLCVLFFLHDSVVAQPLPVYAFQQDDTLLKREYYDQVELQKTALLTAYKGKDAVATDYKTIYEDHYTDIGKLLLSTRTVTDTMADHYLQSVVQRIVRANTELKKSVLRVVFTRDEWPNAMSMGDGTIVINAGLFVRLNNEAEMAFVICHELAHFYLDHSNATIKKYVEMVNSASYQSEIKRLSKEEYMVNEKIRQFSKSLVLDNRRHSREKEAEADSYAYQFMKKTGYDGGAITSCLQLLDTIDDTVGHQPLDLVRAFNFPDYPFKPKWIKKETAIFSQLSEDDSPLTKKEKDSLKTHPDCSQRIQRLQDSISHLPGKKFIVDEKKFTLLQKSFPVEIMEEHWRQRNLGRNLYQALLMLQEQQETPLAIYTVARALNQVYEAQRDHQLGTQVSREDRYMPEDYRLLLRMIARLRLPEIAALNDHFCKKYAAQMKGYAGFELEMEKAATLNK